MIGVKCYFYFLLRQDFLGIYKLVGVKSVKDMSSIIREQLPYLGFPGSPSGKEPACRCRRHERHGFDPWVQKENPLEKEMATHSSSLAWRTP